MVHSKFLKTSPPPTLTIIIFTQIVSIGKQNYFTSEAELSCAKLRSTSLCLIWCNVYHYQTFETNMDLLINLAYFDLNIC